MVDWAPFLAAQYTGPHPEAIVSGAMKARPEGGVMKALAWFGNEDVRLIEAPIPDVVDEEDIILKVTGTTICGSDLHLCEDSTF